MLNFFLRLFGLKVASAPAELKAKVDDAHRDVNVKLDRAQSKFMAAMMRAEAKAQAVEERVFGALDAAYDEMHEEAAQQLAAVSGMIQHAQAHLAELIEHGVLHQEDHGDALALHVGVTAALNPPTAVDTGGTEADTATAGDTAS